MKTMRKVPWDQVIVLAICRFAEPVVLTSVYPYLPEMVESFHVPTERISIWVGFMTASFSFCQFLSGLPWGRWSDKHGRKPAILIGVSTTVVTAIGFGLSTNLWMALFFRSVSGLGNGVVGISRTTVAEMVPDKELQPKVFATMPLMWNIGSVIGPVVGGYLANPAKKFPDSFGHIQFFKTFPYSLPNLVATVVFAVGLTTGWLFLKETLETVKDRPDLGLKIGDKLKRCFSRRKRKAHSVDHSIDGIEFMSSAESSAQPSPTFSRHQTVSYRSILTRQSVIALISYSALSFHNIACDGLLPVFMHTAQQSDAEVAARTSFIKFSGGLGLDSRHIGNFFTANAVLSIALQFTFFPWACRRFGTLTCYRLTSIIYPIVYFAIPLCLLFKSDTHKMAFLLMLMFCKSVATVFGFPCSTILITNSATSMRSLGTLNGIATSASAGGRAMGPAVSGLLFSLGLKLGIVLLPWWTIAFLGALACIPVFMIIEGDGPAAADDLIGARKEGYTEATLEHEAEGLLASDDDSDSASVHDEEAAFLNEPKSKSKSKSQPTRAIVSAFEP